MREMYFPTFYGHRIDLLDLDPDEIDIRDIALGLSRQPRYCGQTSRPLSVAEHSVRLSYLVHESVAGLALLHDATEYIMCDLPRPVKMLIPEYQHLEKKLLYCILKKYKLRSLALSDSEEVEDMWAIDTMFPSIEVQRSGLFPSSHRNLSRINGEGGTSESDPRIKILGEATGEKYPYWGWTWEIAEKAFLGRAWELNII